MTRKMTTKKEQENDQKNGQESGQENRSRNQPPKRLEMARPANFALELIDDPIRIVALSERRESKGLSPFPGCRGLSAAAGG
jgi:hypothetical protein